jgi:hypothetical protein
MPPAFPRSLFALGIVMVVLAAVELVILYRYLGARDAMIGEAERTVMRAALDNDPAPDPGAVPEED